MKSFSILFTLILSIILHSQTDTTIKVLRSDSYGEMMNFKEGILDGNNISTRFNNVGEIGRWPFSPSGEWPAGSGHSYLDGYTFFVTSEVTTPGNQKLVHPLQIYYREWVDKDPVTGELWTFMPVPGYSNQMYGLPAISTIRNSWPDEWPAALQLTADWDGHWYSYFGKDNFYPSQEAFFVMDDSKDAEFSRYPYNYYPVADDQNRKGLGLRIEVRTFQWDMPLASDILFTHYDIYNISDYDYEKTIAGLYLDPGIGGKDDSGDDNVSYDQVNDLVYSFDRDGYGVPNKFKTGYLGIALLETPKSGTEQVGLSSLWVYRLGDGGTGGGWPKDDESIWQKLSSQNFDVSITNANISTLIGAGPFLMDRATGGNKHRLASAMIFSQEKSWLMMKKHIAKEAYDNDYIFPDSLQDLNKFSIVISNPVNQKELKGNVNLTWNIDGGLGKITTYIYLNNRFNSENLISVDSTNNGSCLWNTSSVADGLNFKLVFISFAENGTAVTESEYFNINNTGKPIILATQPHNGESISGFYDIKWITGNVSDSNKLNIYFKPYDDFLPEIVVRNINNLNSYRWNSGDNTNTNSGTLILELISEIDTVVYNVFSLNLHNERDTYTGQNYFNNFDASGTGSVEILRVNSPDITGDNYLIAFNQNTSLDTVYDVINLSTNKLLLAGNDPDDPETPYFEGIRLKVHNDPLEKIDSLTHFENSSSNLNLQVSKDFSSRAYTAAADYRIDFFNEIKDTGFIEAFSQQYRKIPVNITVTNLATGSRNKVAVRDIDYNNIFSIGDQLQILEFFGPVTIANSRISWKIDFNGPLDGSTPIEPDEGDIFFIRTTKPFVPGDSLYFSTAKLTGIKENRNLPAGYSLSQNYPNPFNPTTRIKYSIPEQGNVKLVVYDANGQEIAVLVNREMKAGIHETGFDAGKLSSGIYFYALSYKGQYKTGKMILLK